MLLSLLPEYLQECNKEVQEEYADNSEFAKTSRLLACLPFVPIYSIEEAMFVIYDRTGAHPPMMKFVNAVKQQQRATDFILNRLDHETDDSGKRG